MMLLFKFQRADSSFTNFNGDFIKGFALSLSGDPATGETNKYKQIENEGNKKCPAKMMLQLKWFWLGSVDISSIEFTR